jgi:hypothetical protein
MPKESHIWYIILTEKNNMNIEKKNKRTKERKKVNKKLIIQLPFSS